MLSAYFISLVFLCTCVILVAVSALPGFGRYLIQPQAEQPAWLKVLAVTIGLAFILGFRSLSGITLGDTLNYANSYFNAYEYPSLTHGMLDFAGHIDWDGEIGWELLNNICAMLGLSVSMFFTVVNMIYLVGSAYAIKRIMPRHLWMGFLFFICGFGVFSNCTNGIRNADAIALCMIGLTFCVPGKRNWLLAVLFGIAAYFIHHSAIIIIVPLFASLTVIKSTRTCVYIWVLMNIISLISGTGLAEIGTELFGDERGTQYLQSGEDAAFMSEHFSHTGYRWDFVLYSLPPILLGWYVTVTRKFKDATYQLLLNTYILANAIFIVFIYASFPNRFAALSWAMYPYVLGYPLSKFNLWGRRQGEYASYFLWGCLIFNVVMVFLPSILSTI